MKAIFMLCLIVLFAKLSKAQVEMDKFISQAETGQVIAISQANYDGSTFFFEAITGSRFGHIGVVVVEQAKKHGMADKVFVYHGTPPYAQKWSLKHFLESSMDDKGQVKANLLEMRKSLSKEQKNQLTKNLNQMIEQKIPYDFFHDPVDDRMMDCSEFVHKAFLKIGIQLGKTETLADLNHRSFQGLLLQNLSELLGEKIEMNHKLITPFSIVLDSKLKKKVSSLGMKVLSDQQILDQWYKSGAMASLIRNIIPGKYDQSVSEMEKKMYYDSFRELAGTEAYKLGACGLSAK
ncbi:MAG: YiiX/YebB-like N1pC/P60 family cysteine hydrolase [Bdellovibrionota bacterium]|nr:hypothetical protein [Pseudobdellovibrionaceae bacterium]|tara:strand:- start:207 stop:1082 length:876 start_codon:yes stop_codon:yes gene_type:complete